MCGIFGVFSASEDVANLTYHGLLALQHRGQESAGIAATDGMNVRLFKLKGRVDRFDEELICLEGEGLEKAKIAVGHVRYSNTGGNIHGNYQPFVKETRFGKIALVHNGNLINTEQLRQKINTLDYDLEGNTDSELIAILIAMYSYQSSSIVEAIELALKDLIGSYSIIIMTQDLLIALRDPWGNRPLSYARLNGKSHVFSSETCAFKAIGAVYDSDVQPGEMVIISSNKPVERFEVVKKICQKRCSFEDIYFASIASMFDGFYLETTRRYMGEWLWQEQPVEFDGSDDCVVCDVPDSGLSAATGYAEASGIKYRRVLAKNRYIGRTFIQPSQRLREEGVRAKFYTLDDQIKGKKLVVIEDSIVRGTTTRETIKMLREAGAVEIHMRISSPPYRYCCSLGIDTQKRAELIAATHTIEEIRQEIGADTLGYLSPEGLIRAISREKSQKAVTFDNVCMGCFTGEYPIEACKRVYSVSEELDLV